MRKVAVVQARMGSSRLPCKTLLTLRGYPLIEWIIRRCSRSVLLDEIVVAIPDTPKDDPLADHVQRMGVRVWRGSEQDVLRRLFEAAQSVRADLLVRVCADNPLIWGPEIDSLLRFFQMAEQAGGCDYAYNHIPKGNLYPDGLGAEVVSMVTFETIHHEATLPRHREHCMSWLTDQPEAFRIRTFNPTDERLHRPELKLDMDTVDDYLALARLPIHPGMTPHEIIQIIDHQGISA